MFNGIGVTGVILLVLVALLLFGPNKLPELGRAFGRTLREFKKGANEIMDDHEQDRKETRDESKRLDAGEGADKHDNNRNRRLPD